MNTKQLQAFLVVAQEKQITAAAKRLYMAQPPLSYQMKQLERELGVKLFTRNSYGIELTDAGRNFRQYAQKIVKLTQAAEEDLARENKGELGTVHLGLISSVGNLVPNRALRRLTKYYPRVKFELTEANTMQLVDRLNSNLIDVAIVRTPFNMRGLSSELLFNDRMVAVGDPKRYPILARQSLKIAAFNRQPLIIYRRFEAIFNDNFAQHGITPYYSVKCDDARTAVQWANAGMGVALVPQSIARPYAKQAVAVIDDPNWNSQIRVAWQRGAVLNSITKRLIAILKNE